MAQFQIADVICIMDKMIIYAEQFKCENEEIGNGRHNKQLFDMESTNTQCNFLAVAFNGIDFKRFYWMCSQNDRHILWLAIVWFCSLQAMNGEFSYRYSLISNRKCSDRALNQLRWLWFEVIDHIAHGNITFGMLLDGLIELYNSSEINQIYYST